MNPTTSNVQAPANPQNSQPAQIPQAAPSPSQSPQTSQPSSLPPQPSPQPIQQPNPRPTLPQSQQPITQPPNINPPPPSESPPPTTETSQPDEPTPSTLNPVKKSGSKTGVVIIIIIATFLAIVGTILFVIGKRTVDRINPAANLADSRNATRRMDVIQISTAVRMYLIEPGNSITGLGNIAQCTSGTSAIGTASGNIDLASTLIPDYTTAIPIDPTTGSESDTGYTICVSSTEEITIGAPSAENGENISETR